MEGNRRKARPGLTLYHADYLAFKNILDDAEKGRLLDDLVMFSLAVNEMSADEAREKFKCSGDRTVQACFSLIAEKVILDAAKYAERCEKNSENRRKRFVGGAQKNG